MRARGPLTDRQADDLVALVHAAIAARSDYERVMAAYPAVAAAEALKDWSDRAGTALNAALDAERAAARAIRGLRGAS